MKATQEQLAALATLVSITPETHQWLAKKDYVYPNGCGPGNPRQLVGVSLDVTKLPPLDTPEGDDVFLAPLLRWLSAEDYQPKISGGTVWFEATVEGPDSWQSVEEKHMTLALLRACQSARVPEIVAIFGEGE